MSTFDDRQQAFEAKFAHDAEMQFKAEARRNKLLGLWAAELMGKSGDAAAAYAIEVVKSDFEEAGDEDVFRKLSGDLGDLADAATIRAKMAALMAEAKAQLGDLEPGVADFLLQSLDMKDKCWRLNLDVLQAEMDRIIGFPQLDGQFDGPAFFLSGAKSDYVTAAYRAPIKALFPNAVFAKIPDAGHWLHAEKPREFIGSVAAFLG